jgi:hypothetical protein
MNGRACGALFLTAVAASVMTDAGIGLLFPGGVVTAEELSQSNNRVSAEDVPLAEKGRRSRALLGAHRDGHLGLSLLDDNGTLRAQLLVWSGAERG